MNIPKHWAKSVQVAQAPGGRRYKLVCWQWSDVGVDQARDRAAARANEIGQKVAAGADLDRYAYGERPIREEITQAIARPAGGEIAVVTRNAYGALIVNAAQAMFIDIDFDEENAGGPVGLLQRLTGQRPPSPEQRPLQRIADWAKQYPDLGLRVYRTFAGLRCLITNQVFDPAQSEALDILRALGSDPLYVRLCQAQACFRARLTPKPWRCGLSAPPNRYPWDTSAAEARYRQWEQRYERATAPYAVCKLVQQFGPPETHPEVEPVLALHDRLTGVDLDRRLA